MKMKSRSLCFILFTLLLALVPGASGQLWLPALFADHMVLQRDSVNKVWGKALPGASVSVTLAGQSQEAQASAEGRWELFLEPLPAGGPHIMTVLSGDQRLRFEDVLLGEVWVCSGQSNMEWSVANSNHAEVEIVSANFPEIRLLQVPRRAAQEPMDNFEGAWERCSPESVKTFSAIGYFFGRRLHQTLGVPVGLIDNAWGGSSAEAWVPRPVLEQHPRYQGLIDKWDRLEADFSEEAYNQAIADFEAWQKAGRPAPNRWRPQSPFDSQHRPANIYNGVLHPTIGYGLRGVIWYQGESNAGRAVQYRDLFPLLIRTWRERWGRGDFPFYWVQLADFKDEQPEPGQSSWAELREAQTLTLSLPNTGQAVIIDAGEGRDIHPRDKQTVANRLARIALARDYGFEIAYENPQFAAMKVEDGAILLDIAKVSAGGLRSFDVAELRGFAIAGEDRVFHWAKAEIVGRDQIRVSAPEVPAPVAVRYAWADNPVANVQDRNGLPLTPFRTDDWPLLTDGREQ